MTAKRLGGRPSQVQASQIRDRILDVATELFLTAGYGATSIEWIAKTTGISKRTFYHRFADKAALFSAVVERLIGRMRPADVAPLFEGKTLRDILRTLAKFILEAAVSREAIALHRLIISEVSRFPELAVIMVSEGSRREAIERIAGLLLQHTKNAASENAKFAAEQFLQMVVSAPRERAMGIGTPMTPAERATWAEAAATLFLGGWLAQKA